MSGQKTDSRPPPPSWLNKDLIQTALRTGENDSTITVLSCDFSMANTIGDGYMSDMYRAVAKLQGGKEWRLVIKCVPSRGKLKEMVEKGTIFERETKVFSDTFPKMQRILEKIDVHRQVCAKCFYHGTEPVPFIILEDLRWLGFTLADKLKGLDLEHCRLVLKTQALFHASSLALYEQDPTALDYYKAGPFNEESREDLPPYIENSINAVAKSVLDWPGYERFSEKLKSARSNIFERMKQLAQYKEGKFNTLLHADTWTYNMMFKYNDGVPEDVRLVDFQISYLSSPTIDLQTFLVTCPNEETRKNIDLLLKEYHSNLVNTMTKLKCKTKIITFEELKQDYDEHSVFGLYTAVCILPLIMSVKVKDMNVEDIMHSSDTSVQALNEISQSGVYERVMKPLLLKYEELGIL